MLDHPADALAHLKKRFAQLDERQLAAAFEDIRKITPRALAVGKAGLENAERFNVEAGLLKPEEKLKSYDDLFTDQYVKSIDRPRHSPNPMVAKPSRRANARMITSSPSSRNRRVSPDASVIGLRPPCVSSSRLPRPSSLGAEIVPVPNRSPGARLQPPQAWCATICATVQ